MDGTPDFAAALRPRADRTGAIVDRKSFLKRALVSVGMAIVAKRRAPRIDCAFQNVLDCNDELGGLGRRAATVG